jgi:hypothetical protein
MRKTDNILIIIVLLLSGCDNTTSTSFATFLGGNWKEEFEWHSRSLDIYPPDSVMMKYSEISFFGNTFTVKIYPRHRIQDLKDKTISYSSAIPYSGNYSIRDSIITFNIITDKYTSSNEFYYHIKGDSLYISQAPLFPGQANYRVYPLLWEATSEKHSGVFYRVK